MTQRGALTRAVTGRGLRVRSAQPNARLDDLLRSDDNVPTKPPVPAREAWIGRAALQTFIASAVAYTGLQALNLEPPYPLILAVCAGAVLIRQAVRLTAEPDWQRTSEVVRPVNMRHPIEGGLFSSGDGMLDAVRGWDRRLDWGATGPQRFHHAVVPRLRDVADERLRQRHGVTMATDPERARDILGEHIWGVLTGPAPDRPPTPKEVAVWVERLEKL
jgi:hypothetical protein